jgi:hypothetical protein
MFRVSVIYILSFSFPGFQTEKEMNLKRKVTMDLEVKRSASHLESNVPSPSWNTCFMIKLAQLLVFLSQKADTDKVTESL